MRGNISEVAKYNSKVIEPDSGGPTCCNRPFHHSDTILNRDALWFIQDNKLDLKAVIVLRRHRTMR